MESASDYMRSFTDYLDSSAPMTVIEIVTHQDWVKGDVMIMGEFNMWTPDVMENGGANEETGMVKWVFKARVPAGYRYRFEFLVEGDIISDPNIPISTNKLGRTSNYVIA